MQDIYDIKPLIIVFQTNIWWNLIILLLAILAYFVIFKNKKNIVKTEKIEQNLAKSQTEDLFTYLQKNIEKLNSEEFYKKLDELLRNIIYQKTWKDIKSMSLQEIENLDLDNILKDFVKAIYFKEYAKDIEDSLEIRRNYLEKIESLYTL